MKTKTKIMAFVSLASLTMVLLMVGVWALKTVNFTVGGNLSYIAPGIEATISKGTVTNGVWVNAGDASTKMPLTQITRTDTEESLTTKFSYWQDLNLNFNETGDDVTITFSITNDMTEKYLSINVTTSYASADNATISINTSSAELEPDASQSFTITMKVTDKTANATLSSFAIVFHMEMVEPPKPVTPDEVSYLTFSYNDDLTVSVTECDYSVTEVEVPYSVLYHNQTYKVTSIEDQAFYQRRQVTKITIANSVKSIGSEAFYYCKGIEEMILPEGLESIGEYAFYGCAFSSVKLPSTLTQMGSAAFYGCSNLQSVEIPFGVTSIMGSTFSNCTHLASVIIPNSVESIERMAFKNCGSLISIKIPSSVTSMGAGVFYDCTKLEVVNILTTTPPTISTEEEGLFSGCSALTTINVPKASLGAYKTATGWSDFADLMVGV